MPRRLALLPPILLALAGCGDLVPRPSEILHVAAASDLESALPELEDAFRARTGLALRVSFGSSGQLARQIEQGAPFDLFLCANREFVQGLANRGAVDPDSIRDYARGELVLVVLDELADSVRSLHDLRADSVRRIAIANPDHAPYGIAARQTLENAGLIEAVGPKLVPAENVRQALRFVQSGNAEAALISHSIADLPGVREVEGVTTFPIDDPVQPPIIQALAVNARADQPTKARAFADFLLSETGQAILARHGFQPPPGLDPADAP